MTSPAGLFNKTALHQYQFSYEITLREPTFRAIAVIWFKGSGVWASVTPARFLCFLGLDSASFRRKKSNKDHKQDLD